MNKIPNRQAICEVLMEQAKEDKDIVVDVPYFPFVDVTSVTDSDDTEGMFTTKRIVTTTIQLYFEDPNIVEEEWIPPVVEETETETEEVVE